MLLTGLPETQLSRTKSDCGLAFEIRYKIIPVFRLADHAPYSFSLGGSRRGRDRY